jgi:hypothetical protein
MLVLVKNTSGIEVVINNACSFVDLLWRPKLSIRQKITRSKFSEIQEKQNRMIFIIHSLIFFSKEA